jgi:hypothetical protein
MHRIDETDHPSRLRGGIIRIAVIINALAKRIRAAEPVYHLIEIACDCGNKCSQKNRKRAFLSFSKAGCIYSFQ